MKQFESFRLDIANECLWRSGVQIGLPPKPFAILRYLVENPGRLITHDELLDALWPETYVQPQVLRTYMLELRKVLGDDAGAPRFIQTLPKRGYRFMPTVSEVGEGASSIGSPAPAADTATGPPLAAFVDREPELIRLRSVVRLAMAGQRQVVFITGASGIGKTALVDAFLREIGPADAALAPGQCIEALGTKEQYYPVLEALAQLCASSDGERACRILARIAPLWLPAREPHADYLAERMPGELCAALEQLAAEKLLLLIFEDLHWADESTLGLISALARRRNPAKLMILATCHAQDGSADQPLKTLKQDLVIRRLAVEMMLESLGRRAVGKLLSRELRQDLLPAGLEEFIYRRSEGNPLFVMAIIRHLIAQQHLVRETAAQGTVWRQRTPFSEMESVLPEELSQMIELEIGRLCPEDQRLLEAASLMNVAFPAWAVAAALEEDLAETEEACDKLARRLYFVRRAGQDELPDGTCSAFYVFAHGLYREVLYQRQSASRRARRHTRIAERLAQLFAGREMNVAQEMAIHYEAAGNWWKAAITIRSAARYAHQRRSWAEAVALMEHALRLSENLASAQRESLDRELRTELEQFRMCSLQNESR